MSNQTKAIAGVGIVLILVALYMWKGTPDAARASDGTGATNQRSLPTAPGAPAAH